MDFRSTPSQLSWSGGSVVNWVLTDAVFKGSKEWASLAYAIPVTLCCEKKEVCLGKTFQEELLARPAFYKNKNLILFLLEKHLMWIIKLDFKKMAKEDLIQTSFFFFQTVPHCFVPWNLNRGATYCFRAVTYEFLNLCRHLIKVESFCSESLWIN